ncbi:MAG TPA: ABC transporter [Holosporales bacterium]|nr:ABC transporter [Holosporales bacterium]
MLREPSYFDAEIKEARAEGKSLSVLAKILPYLFHYPWLLTRSLLAVVIASATVLAIGAGLRYFVDYGFSQTSSLELLYALLFLFAIICVMSSASYGRLLWVSELSEKIIADLRKEIFNHLLKMDIVFFEQTSIGEIQSRLTTDTTLLHIILGTSIPIAIRNILIIVGGLSMLLLTSLSLTIIISIVTPLVLIPILVYSKKVHHYSRLAQEKTAAVSSQLEETFSGIRTVFGFSQEERMSYLFAEDVDQAFRTSLKRIKARARLTAFVMILVFGGVAVVLWMGGQHVLQGDMTPGQLSAFLFYAAAVSGASGSLSEIHGDILRAAGAVERIFEFLTLKSSLKIPSSPQPLPSPHRGRIEFQKVSFAYPSRPDRKILKEISFDVNRGETVALVGPSGVGKTTIFNLLMRFYDPLEGTIYLDGLPIDKLDLHILRQKIGLVSQDPFLFSTNFYENIRFGKLDATHEEIEKAAKAAYADEFIENLRDGYYTHLGEKGVALSGGQRQRIAIARAILKNPSILLLDEATSALDSESEEMVQKALKTLKHNRTTLVIAHRNSTIKKADRVVLFSRGEIVATGSPDILKKEKKSRGVLFPH